MNFFVKLLIVTGLTELILITSDIRSLWLQIIQTMMNQIGVIQDMHVRNLKKRMVLIR